MRRLVAARRDVMLRHRWVGDARLDTPAQAVTHTGRAAITAALGRPIGREQACFSVVLEGQHV